MVWYDTPQQYAHPQVRFSGIVSTVNVYKSYERLLPNASGSGKKANRILVHYVRPIAAAFRS
jgi:hypothetical protein